MPITSYPISFTAWSVLGEENQLSKRTYFCRATSFLHLHKDALHQNRTGYLYTLSYCIFLSAFVAIHTSYVKRSVMLNHTPLRISFEKEFSAGCQPRYPIKIPITTWKSFNDALTSRTLLFLFFYTQLSEKINPYRDFLIISKCPFSNIHKINLLFYGPSS